MWNSTIQRRILPRYQSENMRVLNIQFPRAEIEPTTCRAYACVFLPLASNIMKYSK